MSRAVAATVGLLLVLSAWGAPARDAAARARAVLQHLDAIYPQLDALYQDLHAHPELAFQEVETAAKLAERLRAAGIEVTTGVGGHGVVGVLRNGPGPTVLLRADMDALPVEEKTGLSYASKVTGVMHACGHDGHMTAWVGTALLLAGAKDQWRGTVVFVGQPAEEQGRGAAAMLEDGLYTRFPRPDQAVAIHLNSDAPAGVVRFTRGFALANVDSVDVTLYGRGGHGAYPHGTVDPVVMAAKVVLALQTLVSRENDPLDPAVITVGSIHGGTKHNIIPDEVELQLTVRSYGEGVRKQLLEGITRVAKGEAAASRAPREPSITVSDGTHATYNDPELTDRLVGALRREMGAEAVVEQRAVMIGEDFSEYGRAGVPAALFWVGAVEPARYAEAKGNATPLPSTHSPLFAPDRERTLRTAIRAEVAMLMELLQ
ncbi:MAG TPA: amidohydrolase [Candidatus Polarisedimenticolaceae bacterium]|nr:amidohydrolase [Candidatus Polarisedimenticolaceae bacterium]